MEKPFSFLFGQFYYKGNDFSFLFTQIHEVNLRGYTRLWILPYSSTIEGKIDKNEKKRQFNRVYKLMNKYSEQSHHPDVLHKMLLEGRLNMRDLD